MKKGYLYAVTAAGLLGAVTTWIQWDSWIVIPGNREAMLSGLRDPSSAQFRGEFLSKRTNYTCGQVNAKNGMGGYTGFKRYASSKEHFILEDVGVMAAQNLNEKSTQEIIEGLDRKIEFMRTKGRVPTEEELLHAEFEVNWARLCA